LEANVNPAELNHAVITSDLNVAGNADEDYVFEVLPYDRFNNIAVVTDT
jgi:hypothetical protein